MAEAAKFHPKEHESRDVCKEEESSLRLFTSSMCQDAIEVARQNIDPDDTLLQRYVVNA